MCFYTKSPGAWVTSWCSRQVQSSSHCNVELASLLCSSSRDLGTHQQLHVTFPTTWKDPELFLSWKPQERGWTSPNAFLQKYLHLFFSTIMHVYFFLNLSCTNCTMSELQFLELWDKGDSSCIAKFMVGTKWNKIWETPNVMPTTLHDIKSIYLFIFHTLPIVTFILTLVFSCNFHSCSPIYSNFVSFAYDIPPSLELQPGELIWNLEDGERLP